MKINNLHLVNVCQYQDRELAFHPGLNAIIGPNGSGKSNALKAIYAALTNDFRRNSGIKQDNVRQGVEAKEPSYINLKFEHNNTSIELQRSLQHAEKFIQVGDQRLTRDEEITRRVMELLSITPEIMDDYVFVDQSQMFAFLDLSSARRSDVFQRLFNTTRIADLYEMINKQINSITVLDSSREIEQRRAYIADKERRLVEIDMELQSYQDLGDVELRMQECRHALDAWGRKQVLKSQIASKEQFLLNLTSELGICHEEVNRVNENLQTCRDYLAAEEEAYQEAKLAMRDQAQRSVIHIARQRLETALEKITAEKATRRRPVKNGLYIEVSPEWLQCYHELELRVRELRRFVVNFDPTRRLNECPECGTPVEKLHDKWKRSKDELIIVEMQYSTRRQQLEFSQRFDDELQAYTSWKQSYDKRMQSLQEQLEALPKVDPQELDLERMTLRVKEYSEVENCFLIYEDTHRVAAAKLSGLETHIDVIHKSSQELRKEEQSIQVDAVQRESAQGLLDRLTQASRDQARLEGEREATVLSLRQDEETLQGLVQRQRTTSRNSRLRAYLASLADILHRDKLPRIIAHYYLNQINAGTNEFLELFAAPFRIEPTEDLSFSVRFLDGRETRVGRLSSGQKTVLAWSFRLRVHLMFSQDIGFLALDEPTESLDEHNIRCLHRALERLRELSHARGLQILLVTHARSLASYFDQVISLGSDEAIHD